jgi:predicted TIM-barrel fold metal-dependent hydrolase
MTQGAGRGAGAPSPIIDFHVHPGFSLELPAVREAFAPMVREAQYHGVDQMCVSTLDISLASPPPARVREENDLTRALMEDYPGRVVGLCHINPLYPDEALAEIDRCVAAGMSGIKLWISCKASHEAVDPVAARAAALRLPILQHAWYKVQGEGENESTPADVAALAARHPKTMIVMAHLTGCGERGLADIAPHRNVLVDTSGGDPEAGLTELAVKRLGAHRVVFGTDSPIRSYGATLGKILGAKLSPSQRARILSGNAQRLLGRARS